MPHTHTNTHTGEYTFVLIRETFANFEVARCIKASGHVLRMAGYYARELVAYLLGSREKWHGSFEFLLILFLSFISLGTANPIFVF